MKQVEGEAMNNSSRSLNLFGAISVAVVVAFGLVAFPRATSANSIQAVQGSKAVSQQQANKLVDGGPEQQVEALAKQTFERLKKFEGKWTGRSTKGWQEVINFKTIAQGSVVHESSFDAHPNETMATMYYLDGRRLLLTHYCVSKTQPRLHATAFEDGGRKVTFTFLDATSLPSRDKGHMDKVIINFVDDTHFTSQWTWYQDGKEQWLEEIRYERVK
jgi:hypothetical protein